MKINKVLYFLILIFSINIYACSNIISSNLKPSENNIISSNVTSSIMSNSSSNNVNKKRPTQEEIDLFEKNFDYWGSIGGYRAIIKEYIGSDTEVIIPDFVELILKNSFQNGKKIKTLTIGSGVKKIDYGVFSYCYNMESVYYTGTIEQWCNIEFMNEHSNPMFRCPNFYMLNENNEWCEVNDITIPNTITEIKNFTFLGQRKLVNVSIPNGVTKIGKAAFQFCNLKKLEIPDGVISIGHEAFVYNTEMEFISIPDSVISIGVDAFAVCDKLKYNEYENCLYLENKNNPYYYLIEVIDKDELQYNIHENTKIIGSFAFWNCKKYKSIIIPDGVISLGASSFSSYSLTDVVIPDSVIYIDMSPFDDELENVYYKGTIEQWNNIIFYNKSSNPMKYAEHFYILDENGNWTDATDQLNVVK